MVQKSAKGGRGDSVLPSPAEKAAAVRSMFSAIAPRYDLLNHLLSLNMDKRWRRATVDLLLDGARGDGLYLDACAGTLDLGHELASRPRFQGRVVACDFTPEMLQRGVHKAKGLQLFPAAGDTQQLPLRDASCDGAMVAFGVRNLASLEVGLRELARVVKPNGRLIVLEFTTPSKQPIRGLYLFYFRRLLPAIGRVISRHGSAYSYLPASVLAFPEPPALGLLMKAAGFSKVTWKRLTFGIVAIHIAVRG